MIIATGANGKLWGCYKYSNYGDNDGDYVEDDDNCDDYDDDNDEAWTLQGEKWVAAASAQDFPSQRRPGRKMICHQLYHQLICHQLGVCDACFF